MTLKRWFDNHFDKKDYRFIIGNISSVGNATKRPNVNFNQDYFSQLISKKSKIQVINIKNKNELSNYFKKNLLEILLENCKIYLRKKGFLIFVIPTSDLIELDNGNNNLGRKINDLEIIQIINLNSYHKKHSIIIARY